MLLVEALDRFGTVSSTRRTAGLFRRRIASQSKKLQALSDAFCSIELQKRSGNPADWGRWDNSAVLAAEVITPSILSWIKQEGHTTCFGVDRRDVSALVPVAEDTSQSEVFQRGWAAVLATDDVVHLMVKP
jgi:hypothetical protein